VIKRVLVVVVAVLALAGAATGCSDKKDEGVPRDEFVRKATAICKATAKQVEAAKAEAQESGDVDTFVSSVSGTFLDQVDKLRKLGAPTGDQKRLDVAYGVYEEVFSKWQANPGTFPTGADDPAFVSAQKTLASFGLDDCTGP
jgi:hypothetical protein